MVFEENQLALSKVRIFQFLFISTYVHNKQDY